MIVYASGKLLATDNDGDTQNVGVIDADRSTLRVGDLFQRGLLENILLELKKITLYFNMMVGEEIQDMDVEV